MVINTSGGQNTAVGVFSLYANRTGWNNTALGVGALENLSSGSNNIAVGNNSGFNISTGNNNIDIGALAAGNESDTVRIGSSQSRAFVSGISGATVSNATGLVCVGPSGQLGVGSSGLATFVGNLQIGSGSTDYRYVELGGGNSSGFLYGSYPVFGDGIHLSYNYYADAGGSGHAINPGGATSRVSVGYGSVVLAVGNTGQGPYTARLTADGTGVAVTGTFNNGSDRNLKQDFSPISPAHILDKVADLPISEWSYKTDAATRHIGPMAQDFSAAFEIGTDDKHIAPLDEGGIALAAIQALNQKVEQQQAALKGKDAEIQDLKEAVTELQNAIRNLPAKHQN